MGCHQQTKGNEAAQTEESHRQANCPLAVRVGTTARSVGGVVERASDATTRTREENEDGQEGSQTRENARSAGQTEETDRSAQVWILVGRGVFLRHCFVFLFSVVRCFLFGWADSSQIKLVCS